MNMKFMKPFCVACAVGVMAWTTSSVAQQNNAESKTKAGDNDQTVLNDHSEKCIAELSKTVDLDEDQKLKIRDVYLQSEKTLQPVWAKYNQAQMSAAHLEAEMYAAMESRMTDAQQTLFTAGRKSQQQKMAAGTYASSATTPKKTTDVRAPGARISRTANSKPLKKSDSPKETLQEGSKAPSDIFVQQAIFAPMEQVMVSVGLGRDEIAKCETTCHAYHTKLNSAWKEINQIRNRLVTEESKAIEAVAKVLTEEQINKLKQHRVSVAENSGSSSRSKKSSR